MKVGLFLQSYSSGGVDTFLVNLVNNLKLHSQIVIFYNHNYPGMTNLKKKFVKKITFVKYRILSLDDLDFFKKFIIINLVTKFFLILFFPVLYFYQSKKLLNIISRNKLDRFLVINGGYPGGDLCRIASIVWYKLKPDLKSWHNFHNIAVKKDNFFLNNFYRNKIDLKLKSCVKGFVAVSNSCCKSLRKRKYLKDVKIIKIYNGYNRIKFKKKNIRKELKLGKKSKLLLLLGEYNLRKGHQLIIKVMKELTKNNKDIYLLICGYGTQIQIDFVRDLIKEANLKKNIFLKNFRYDNLNLISQCNLLVVPSLRFESFGYTAVEAMSLRKPVIASNIGGLKEVVENSKTGFLIKKNDHKLFANKVLYLLKNAKKNKIMGDNGFRRYKRYYTSQKMAIKYSELIFKNTYNEQK